MQQTKISQLKSLISTREYISALKLASRFPRIDAKYSNLIKTGADCAKHPEFYKQIKKNPEDIINAGINALIKCYM